MNIDKYDAIVIGGGFYGATIALYLATERQMARVLLVEQGDALMTRASKYNQARVHNGYHYPRCMQTARSSRVNFSRFRSEWSKCIRADFQKLYAIARFGSSTSALRFKSFCDKIGAECRSASPKVLSLFNQNQIEAVYLTEEPVFDANAMAQRLVCLLNASPVRVSLSSTVHRVTKDKSGKFLLYIDRTAGVHAKVTSTYVFNCTYSALDSYQETCGSLGSDLRHEMTQMALIEVPHQLQDYGITVMDGPFFSAMPYPQRGCHSLSHVRYTPEARWLRSQTVSDHLRLKKSSWACRAALMLKDASKYVPKLRDSKCIGTVREIKTLLTKNAHDDGRPILFEKHETMPGMYSILGGKLDNVYDVLEVLNAEQFPI